MDFFFDSAVELSEFTQMLKVPHRGKGRKTIHCEKDSAFNLVILMVSKNIFELPIRIEMRDKPDCFIDTGSRKIGVEITELVAKNEAKFDALSNCGVIQSESEYIDLGAFDYRDEEKNLDELKEIASEDPFKSNAVFGEKFEEELEYAIKDRIHEKKEKFHGYTFRKENWLLLYDNLSKPGTDEEMVMESLKNDGIDISPFSSLILLSGSYLIKYDCETRSYKYLWEDLLHKYQRTRR